MKYALLLATPLHAHSPGKMKWSLIGLFALSLLANIAAISSACTRLFSDAPISNVKRAGLHVTVLYLAYCAMMLLPPFAEHGTMFRETAGETALSGAIRAGNREVVRFLKAAGAK